MDSDDAGLEERLKSLLIQQRAESGILERIVYKGKNQHRRSSYFQALLKVRRDLRLLQSAELGQILHALLPIIEETDPVEDAHHLKLSKKKYLSGKCNYHNRLLGVARLLSQMVEPILKAAIQISLLLAKTFFMGFSLTVLACLARLRVLVQQMLLDVVLVFNKVSVHSQKQVLKVSREGIEAFVEYYSDIRTLKCIFEEDKFVLHESTQTDRSKKQEEQGDPLEAPPKYQTVESFDRVGSCLQHEDSKFKEAPCLDVQPPLNSSGDQSAETDSSSVKSIDCKSLPACNPSAGIDSFQSARTTSSQTESRKRVAFVAVRFSEASEFKPNQPEKKMRLNSLSTVDADPLPCFPLGECLNRTLF